MLFVLFLSNNYFFNVTQTGTILEKYFGNLLHVTVSCHCSYCGGGAASPLVESRTKVLIRHIGKVYETMAVSEFLMLGMAISGWLQLYFTLYRELSFFFHVDVYKPLI